MAVDLTKRFYVLIFETELALGGREEGGWWYTRGELDCYYDCETRKEAEELAKELREGEFKGKGNLSSVNHRTGDTFEVWIENRIITHFPEKTPHYE